METRVNIQQVQPNAYKALFPLENYLATTSLTKIQKERIKIRVSQIKGCAFCLNLHTQDALQYGETNQRIFLMNAWKETNKFTDEEKAILAITEEATLIHQNGLTQATYEVAKKYFSEEVIAQIIMAVKAINTWNRIAISTHLPG